MSSQTAAPFISLSREVAQRGWLFDFDRAAFDESSEWARLRPHSFAAWWKQHGRDEDPTRLWEDTVDAAEGKLAAGALLAGYEAYSHANWDMFGAQPITADTLAVARELIAALIPSITEELPDAAPSADGSIGFEWWDGKSYLFIDVGPAFQVFTYLNCEGMPPIEEHFEWGDQGLLQSLKALFRRLYAAYAAFGGSATRSIASTYFAVLDSGAVTQPLPAIFGFAPSLTSNTSPRGGFTTAPWADELLVFQLDDRRHGRRRYQAV